MKLTDTHCHLDFYEFEKDRAEVLTRALNSGVEQMLVPGIDLESSQAAIDLAELNKPIFAAVGVHPNSANKWDMRTIGFLDELTCYPKVVAVGEIGLDYYRDWAPQPLQKRIFKEQLNLAQHIGLPVVIHTRNHRPDDRTCIAETLDILSDYHLKGVFHSFSGNVAEAERAVAMGFFIGITGPVTYKNAVELQSVVASLPLDYLLIETDSPFMAPASYRGKRNEPAYVRYVAEKIAEIHNQSTEFVAETTAANAKRLFRWGD
jgi:TatD DNase family protein